LRCCRSQCSTLPRTTWVTAWLARQLQRSRFLLRAAYLSRLACRRDPPNTPVDLTAVRTHSGAGC
jgi:hypothetical protein